MDLLCKDVEKFLDSRCTEVDLRIVLCVLSQWKGTDK